MSRPGKGAIDIMNWDLLTTLRIRGLFPIVGFSDTKSILRAIGSMPRDVLALVRHLRRHPVANG